MGLVDGLWLTVLGVLAAFGPMLARRPDAKEALGKIAPFQGLFGVISALWGVWGVISSVLDLAQLAFAPIHWATCFASAILSIALGLLLVVGVLGTLIEDAPGQAKANQTAEKLAPIQRKLGLVAIAVGLWTVVAGLIWTV